MHHTPNHPPTQSSLDQTILSIYTHNHTCTRPLHAPSLTHPTKHPHLHSPPPSTLTPLPSTFTPHQASSPPPTKHPHPQQATSPPAKHPHPHKAPSSPTKHPHHTYPTKHAHQLTHHSGHKCKGVLRGEHCQEPWCCNEVGRHSVLLEVGVQCGEVLVELG